ncbi:MAG: helix-turn-helix transcriptional regulator [Lachnospiraceae bacterium]|nr:helix-turn-helix transcriptional regulator [Lachnospiraceae bacterium]
MERILATITTYREERNWTEYQLAEHAGLPQSTISSWYCKNTTPTLSSLEKICTAFGITLSQLFVQGEEPVSLTEPQRTLLKKWTGLTQEQQTFVLTLIDNMKKRN